MTNPTADSAEPSWDIAFLDMEQARHAQSLGTGHRLIYGVAGSGKTVLLLARAKYADSQHAQQRILVLCFNVALAAFIRNRLRGCRTVEVRHFDDWSRRLGVSRGHREEDESLGSRLLTSIRNQGDGVRTYDAVLIDEAQDFAPSWFECVLGTMKDPANGDLVIVSDANQGLYRRRRVSWKSLGIRAQGRTTRVDAATLDYNYRNTREIVDLAVTFARLSSGNEEDQMQVVPLSPDKTRRSNGLKPRLLEERFRSAECKRVCSIVRKLLAGEWGRHTLPYPLKPEQIGVLYPLIPGQCQNEFNVFLKSMREFTDVVWLTDDSSRGANREKVSEPGVKIQTIHSAKGLEYQAVIIMWADLLPRHYFDDYDAEEDQMLMFVALTRARDFLAITYSRPSDFMAKIKASRKVELR